MRRLLTTSVLIAGTSVFAVAETVHAPSESDKRDYKRPLEVSFPKNAPYSPQLATLGKKLFFDPRLSGATNMSCATCHNPSFGFGAPVDLAVGAANVKLGRHVPTALNAAWTEPLFWDGRAPNLEAQAEGPITAPVEMNMKMDRLETILKGVPEYNSWFERLFPGKGVTRETILTAIATYERTIVSGWAPFDRWIDGDTSAMTPAAVRGFELFKNKARCAGCHSGWNFTDNKFHDIGTPNIKDIGRAKYEKDNPKALYAFKTPGLRNLTQRAPFTHDGSQETLAAIIRHYETGGVDRPSLSPLMVSFSLTDAERDDLVAFLKSLTEEKAEVSTPVLPN